MVYVKLIANRSDNVKDFFDSNSSFFFYCDVWR